MPGHKKIPEWDVPIPPGCNDKPSTPFSKPRDPKLTNKTMIDALALAAGLSDSQVSAITADITYSDGCDDGKGNCSMSVCGGVWKVHGGRLGRDHTLEDVPIHFCRDKLMDYIWESVKSKEERQASRRAICSDLTEGEISEYIALIVEDRQKKEEERNPLPTLPTREEKARAILRHNSHGDIRTYDQAMKVVLMYEAASEIDETVDWKTPKSMGIRRNLASGPGRFDRSVITPHWAPPVYEEDSSGFVEVDRDCDQVRAMISIFCGGCSSWSLDVFRDHLGSSMTRDKFTTFLNKRGTDSAQLKSGAYLLSWEFLKRREHLGFGIENVDFRDDLDTMRKRDRPEGPEDEEEEVMEPEEQLVAEARRRQHKDEEGARVTEKKVIAQLQDKELAALKNPQPVVMDLAPSKARTATQKKRGASATAKPPASKATPLGEVSSKRLNKRLSDGGDRVFTKRVTRSAARAQAITVG
ncbi:hypothetical protein QBC34DRAFT_417589 [Podospora aff. communis PSN243]|uniref:DUF7726 domain-containing protein n=1 Tax=Podospora aff. communis PSN243 TaxID=3040156 RepID=A0AAV9G6I3_9PEZI|nr:hypothetical protein QBC34DRAFT_417589 [Podospora aff. communis PSN243]